MEKRKWGNRYWISMTIIKYIHCLPPLTLTKSSSIESKLQSKSSKEKGKSCKSKNKSNRSSSLTNRGTTSSIISIDNNITGREISSISNVIYGLRNHNNRCKNKRRVSWIKAIQIITMQIIRYLSRHLSLYQFQYPKHNPPPLLSRNSLFKMTNRLHMHQTLSLLKRSSKFNKVIWFKVKTPFNKIMKNKGLNKKKRTRKILNKNWSNYSCRNKWLT